MTLVIIDIFIVVIIVIWLTYPTPHGMISSDPLLKITMNRFVWHPHFVYKCHTEVLFICQLKQHLLVTYNFLSDEYTQKYNFYWNIMQSFRTVFILFS